MTHLYYSETVSMRILSPRAPHLKTSCHEKFTGIDLICFFLSLILGVYIYIHICVSHVYCIIVHAYIQMCLLMYSVIYISICKIVVFVKYASLNICLQYIHVMWCS